jgi:hypothetical protein
VKDTIHMALSREATAAMRTTPTPKNKRPTTTAPHPSANT